MTGVYVVDTSIAKPNNSCRAILGFRNVLSQNISDNVSGVDDDINYPLSLAFDYSYASEYSPNLATHPTSETTYYYFSSTQKLNYFMLISKNAQASGLSVLVEVFRAETAAYETVANFGSMKDGKPVMVYFGDLYASGYINGLQVRTTITYTAKPYIMSMMCGLAIAFERTFSLGFQPAYAAYLDEVEQFDADDGLNVTIGRRLAKGKQLKGSINFVNIAGLKDFWDEFANHVLDVKPICMLWNTKVPDEAVYGVQVPQRLTKPAYKTSNSSSVDFEIIGWA